MIKSLSIALLITFYAFKGYSQDIELTPDMYDYSENSITGVYVCTPTHVENGDCSAVDKEYYDNLAIMTLGLYEIGILSVNDIDTVAFKGPLSPGAAESLIAILDKYPEIDTLVLSSQGGSEEEAYKIADYIQAKKMKTWVPVRRMCLSACAWIFLSGIEPQLDGLLGLHSGQFYIQDSYQIKDLETARETIQNAMFENDKFMMRRIRLLLSLDISLEVVDQMIEAKGQFLVFMDLEELFHFQPEKNYVKSLKDMSALSSEQPAKNFEFQGYQQLF